MILLAAALTALPAPAAQLTRPQLDFFEQRIRPIFQDKCYKCHSHDSDKVRGGLMLDTRDGLLKGGETGPAIIPGDPEKSLLIKAVRYKDKDMQMPPGDRQLPADQIHDLEGWVKMGAPDPRNKAVAGEHKYQVDFAAAKKHWAFQPVTKPAVPQPEDPLHWAQTPVDNFILAGLRAKKLTPSPPADKVALLRRASFDLVGLPPSPRELDDFLADNSAEAFARVVDRLLASPHYGERWGRHWLDVAHYADTRGADRDDRYPYSYVYRDYVIRAFNQDLPYDQFLLQQIAADKLPSGDDKHALAALGFLTLGNRFNNQANDIIDDRIDIIGKSTMALTLACARCHDHKFDPIPTADYYALHGVFSSCIEPREGPIIEPAASPAAYEAFLKEQRARQAQWDAFRNEMAAELRADMIGNAGNYMLAVMEFRRQTNRMARNVFMDKRKLNPQVAAAWDASLRRWENQRTPLFAPWFAFASLAEKDFASRAHDLAAKYYANSDRGKPLNPLLARMFANTPATLGQVAARYSAVFNDVEKRWREALASSSAARSPSDGAPAAPDGLDDRAQEEIRRLMYANGSPMLADEGKVNNFIDRDGKRRNKRDELQRAITDLLVNHPGSPGRAPVLADADHPHDSNILVKGNPGNRGPVVPRHFLSILSDGTPAPFSEGSGRLELARAIASKDNPLTPRVMVNRVWLHHFGEGLVRSPDDFGSRGDTPSHPELLDYLASRFMAESWSLKKLHRLIMLSAVYQQSSDDNPRYEQIDPDNRWLWRANRRRLDFEALRDAILTVGGDLDGTLGGRPVRLDAEPYSLRRSVYGFVDRRNLPDMLRAFDFASPDLTTGKRETTVVPQQALFMMNSQLVVDQARNALRRADFKTKTTAESRIEMLYKLIYQRPPTEVETRLAISYLRSDVNTEWQTTASDAWGYGYGEYDAAARRLKYYAPMANFDGNAWHPDARATDARLKTINLNPGGGLPGKPFSVVRRWIAPRDGTISIDSTLGHGSKDGDGVYGRIVSSRQGELAGGIAARSQAPLKLPRVQVRRGDWIDFITDCRENPKGDNFNWPVVIKMEPAPNTPADAILEWNSRTDFSADAMNQRLNSWEKFAQVLLETNEFIFVN